MKTAAIAAAVLAAWVGVVKLGGDDPNPYARAADRPAGARLVQGKDVRWWAARAIRARQAANARARTIRRLRRGRLALIERPYEHAARLAAIAYHVDAAMLIRIGRCETANWAHFTNPNSGAAGPWQFLAGTWQTTPYARFSPYDPDAAALAAAWMHSRTIDRGNEWSCR